MSCNSAGPRGPAVMMLVLSATGCTVFIGKTLRCGHEKLPGSYRWWVWRVCLAGPGRGADHAAEILGPEGGSLSASTSALTVPKVVSGLWWKPS